MAKECRGLSLVAPSRSSDDAAYLGPAHTVLISQDNAGPSSELYSTRADRGYLFCRQFCRATLFSVLHGAVVTHVHLVIRMSSPAQVILAIVSWVAVSVRYIRQFFWVWYKRHSDQPMHRPGVALGAPWQVQHDGSIPSAHRTESQQVPRRIAGLTPVNRHSVTAYLAIVRNFVIRKRLYLFPHGGLQ